MPQEYLRTVKYGCKDDDEQFIHAPDVTCARRIRWIQGAIGRSRWECEETLLEILAGNEEDVWLWVDGDEAALPEPGELIRDKLPYTVAAKALQTRQASERFESREMAETRQRVQSASLVARLAVILWLFLTSKATKKLDSEHGLMNREEWDLSGLMEDWWYRLGGVHSALWFGLYDVLDQLPEAPTEEFERAMEKEGHTCHIELMSRYIGPKMIGQWLYVQSVLFPEHASAPVNLMRRNWKKSYRIECEACRNHANQHYSRVHRFYAPSPYAVFLATILHHSSGLEEKGPSFLDWITALSSRQDYKKLTSAGRQLCETLQSELEYHGHLEHWDTRYASWINSYPIQWRFQLSNYSSKTWKLADSIMNSLAGSSSASETVPDFATWLAAAIWTMCTHDESLTVGRTIATFYQRLEYTISRLYSIRALLTDSHPPSTDIVEKFRHKIKNHSCWDTSKHDPGWYASAVSYLNNGNDLEFVPYFDAGDSSKAACEECHLVNYATGDQLPKVLFNSLGQASIPELVEPHVRPQSTISLAPTSGNALSSVVSSELIIDHFGIAGPVLDRLAFDLLKNLYLQKPWKTLCKMDLSPSGASYIMKIIQNELDANQQHEEYSRKCMRLLRKMAQTYGVLPPSFLLSDSDLATAGKRPVCGGGFSDIYRGKLGDQDVCIKVLRVFTTTNMREELVKQFCHEAILWGQFKHPNILPFLGVSFDLFEPSFCLVSPWMENGNILQFLERNSTYDRMTVIREVAEGLKYLHAFNPPVVHADIRGANILVTSDLRCCLADFGLAVVVESQIFTTTTSMNNNRGTMRWMAPEVLLPSTSDKSSSMAPSRDVYAFACTVLELCTGQVPFHEDRLDITVLHKVVQGERPQRPSSDIWFPDEVWDLVQMCWEQDPTTRPTARKVVELMEDLEKRLQVQFRSLGSSVEEGMSKKRQADALDGSTLEGRSRPSKSQKLIE